MTQVCDIHELWSFSLSYCDCRCKEVEMKFHSQATIQYACFFLKITEIRKQPRRLWSGFQDLLECEGKEAE
jgi:hypothetical protein